MVAKLQDLIWVYEANSCSLFHLQFLKQLDLRLVLFYHRKMLGRDNNHSAPPMFIDENNLLYQANASNQLQLFGTVPMGSNVDRTNYYFGNDQSTPVLLPRRRVREIGSISRPQKLQNTRSYNVSHNEVDLLGGNGIQNQNHVSTGLKLSYDDDERNSSVTSSSGSMMMAPPPFLISLGDNIMAELDRQKEELDHYIINQGQVLAKGIREMKQRQMTSFLASVEKGIVQKLQEKDLEIENINQKNKELVERIKRVAAEAQSWHYKAKYNESIVNVLRNNLQQAISKGAADQGKEGFGDSEIEDDASYIDPNNYLGIANETAKRTGLDQGMICKVCKLKEVSVLVMPCRHLCLCGDCNELICFCPICENDKSASVQVYFP